jgi:predicted RNA polymerase sigma factor
MSMRPECHQPIGNLQRVADARWHVNNETAPARAGLRRLPIMKSAEPRLDDACAAAVASWPTLTGLVATWPTP